MALEDMVPTVLHLMGLPVPNDIDGRVLTEILTPDALASRPVQSTQPVGFWPSDDTRIFEDEAMSQEDDADIRKRLQALGYLE
jgi:arylsulfatase A-like enzyme